jgi:hypothetical protein
LIPSFVPYLNSNRHSLLHKAAQRGHTSVCQWLLGNECALDDVALEEMWHRDGEGYDPAGLARLHGFDECADVIDARRAATASVVLE